MLANLSDCGILYILRNRRLFFFLKRAAGPRVTCYSTTSAVSRCRYLLQSNHLTKKSCASQPSHPTYFFLSFCLSVKMVRRFQLLVSKIVVLWSVVTVFHHCSDRVNQPWSPCLVVAGFSLNTITAGTDRRLHSPTRQEEKKSAVKQWNPISTFPQSRVNTPRSLQTSLFATTNNNQGNEDENGGIETSMPSKPWERPVLSLVDTAMIVSFAAVGKASHNTVDGSLDVLAVAQTAAPFLVSWFVIAPLLGCFTPMATGDWKESTLTTTKAWILAIPVGCLLRGIIKGYVPPSAFVIVTMIATWVFLVGGRSVYTILSEVLVETF